LHRWPVNLPQGFAARMNYCDTVARSFVKAHLADGSPDERSLRATLCEIVMMAGIPQQVTQLVGRGRHWSVDFGESIEARLVEVLCKFVDEKLVLEQLLTGSLCGWARNLLRQYAVRSAMRSEVRSRRFTTCGSRKLPHPSYEQDFEILDADGPSDEFIKGAAKIAGENTPHLNAWALSRYYGLPQVPRCAGGRPQMLDGGQIDWLSSVSKRVQDVILASMLAPRIDVSHAVRQRFFCLAKLMAPRGEDGVDVARKWLNHWVEERHGAMKSHEELCRDLRIWQMTAQYAMKKQLFAASNPDQLSSFFEDLLWRAHYEAAVTSGRRRSTGASKAA